ncbi:hypothetical protein [Rudaea cellulosilytica]|uniref:hypothetical protein n=1 Tax=Rudaea cellulosilytica TaxID=540746 RepID=UPI0003804D13|nr:hypothetical protein [Rudaea cellulosilytica]
MTQVFRSAAPVGDRKSHWPQIALWLLSTLAIWAALSLLGQRAELSVDLEATAKGYVQLYLDTGRGYSEQETTRLPLSKGTNHVSFVFSLEHLRGLRLDPIDSDAGVVMTRIAVRSRATLAAWRKLSPQARIPSSEWRELSPEVWKPLRETVVEWADAGLAIVPGKTMDPGLELISTETLGLSADDPYPIERVFVAVMLGWILAALLRRWLSAGDETLLKPVVVAPWVVAVLILAMAQSAYIHHQPDERSHLGAFQYYLEHPLPPAVDDPATIPSTSMWGHSYLEELDVVYAIAARIAAPLASVWSDDLFAARMFQLGLWLLLCVTALRKRRWAWGLSVLLLSPQIWYVFSYFNADAFPLTLALLAVLFVGDEESGLRRYLAGDKFGAGALAAIVCLGLLLVSKRNYMAVFPAIVLWLAVLHLDLRMRDLLAILFGLLALGMAFFLVQVPAISATGMPKGMIVVGGLAAIIPTLSFTWICSKDPSKRKIFLRLVAMVLLCLAVAAPRLAWDVWKNGTPAEKSAKLETTVEARARADFKPSAIAVGEGYEGLALAAHGVSLKDVMFAPKKEWLSRTLCSAFGVYGYMIYYAPEWTYWALGLLFLMFLALSLAAVRRAHPAQGMRLMAIVLGVSLLVFTQSLLLSWVYALEPQGRYLFPILALLAMAACAGAERLSHRRVAAVVLTAAAIGVGSFLWFAMPLVLMH